MTATVGVQRLIQTARRRPAQIIRAMRGYLLFQYSRLIRLLHAPFGVELEENVRLQRNSSVMCEYPHARIRIARDSIVYEDSTLEAYGDGIITVGSQSIIGGARIISRHRVTIGNRCLCSWNVQMQDFDPHPIDPLQRRHQVESMIRNFRPQFDSVSSSTLVATDPWPFPGSEIVIGDDVWIGMGVIILKGARIGDGAIVAAGAVVPSGAYPARSILAGNPAVVVKQLS